MILNRFDGRHGELLDGGKRRLPVNWQLRAEAEALVNQAARGGHLGELERWLQSYESRVKAERRVDSDAIARMERTLDAAWVLLQPTKPGETRPVGDLVHRAAFLSRNFSDHAQDLKAVDSAYARTLSERGHVATLALTEFLANIVEAVRPDLRPECGELRRRVYQCLRAAA